MFIVTVIFVFSLTSVSFSGWVAPAKQMWRHIKDNPANIVFDSLDKLSDKECQLVKELTSETVLSIAG